MATEVQLITGPARSGKTQMLLQQYRRQLRADLSFAANQRSCPCCWLAPNQTAVSQLRDSLLRDSSTAILQPNLFTFASFSESIVVRSGRRISAISPTQKRRLIRHVIEAAQRQGSIEHFARVASTPGFIAEVDQFIAEQKRADVWPEQLLQRRPGSEPRNRELAKLYADYQRHLHNGDLYDAEGRFWAAREVLTDLIKSTPQQFELVVVNGFNDFTPAQLDILRLVSQCSSQLLISLTVELPAEVSDPLLFAKTSDTLAQLQESLPAIAIQTLEPPTIAEGSLRELQAHAFREPNNAAKAKSANLTQLSGVEILAARNELEEIELVAQRIKNLLTSKLIQPHDIIVVSRGGEATATLIDAVFPDFGIPYTAELRPRLESEPLIRALCALLRLQLHDWPFQTLLEVIGNRLLTRFDAPVTDELSVPTRAAMEYCVRSAQLPGGKSALFQQLEYRVGSADFSQPGKTDKFSYLLAVGSEELRQIDTLISALPEQAALDAWIPEIEKLLKQFGLLSEGSQSRSRSAMTWELTRRHLREAAKVDVWMNAHNGQLSLNQVLELIASLAREQRMPANNDGVGCVRVLSAESARKLATRHLFLVGLSEQSFSDQVNSEKRASTRDESAIAESGATRADDVNTSAPDEFAIQRSDAMLLFYELVTRPTESLTLSYPALDNKGQPLPPSPLLTDLQHSVGDGRIQQRSINFGQQDGPDASPASTGMLRRQAVKQALAGKHKLLAAMNSHGAYARTAGSILHGIECVAQRGVRDSFGQWEGILSSNLAQATLTTKFDAEHLWSASQLEGYAKCPYRFFGEQLLKLEPPGELTLSNDARRRGSLLHHVLAQIHEQLSHVETDGAGMDNDELVQRFLATLDAAVKAAPLRGIEQSLREIERREIESWAADYAEQEAAYRNQWKHLDQPPRPTHFEVRFGPETRSSAGEASDKASTHVPFELDLGDQQLRLTGQIDRVDVGRVGDVTVFNIIDYKSGQGVKLKYERVRSGHQLQLPLYALAAEQLLLAEQSAVALATGYWNIQGQGFGNGRSGPLQLRELTEKGIVTSDDWKNLQPEILTRLKQLVAGIRAGHFPVYNEDEHCTRSCELSTICRVAQIRSLAKVWPVETASEQIGGASIDGE